ncbi:hypothetical protein TRAPUB_3662 [Trametes pubescens]|uniref:Uncharacterized protein n=1 Tax=Trametes pubescens TaxID=154538 RepID=A0A1M2VDA7_TRAPU|nr:hypothetical protein TRAPUB_3662 [Trametes pubescens]
MPAFSSRLATARAWVDPESLPTYLDAADITGNVPDHVKQLVLNTLGAYGVGGSDCFAHTVGRRIRIAEMNCHKRGEKTEVVVVAEAQACKATTRSTSRALGRSCASFPLVALGLMQDINGVGVSQAMNVFFHAPAAM